MITIRRKKDRKKIHQKVNCVGRRSWWTFIFFFILFCGFPILSNKHCCFYNQRRKSSKQDSKTKTATNKRPWASMRRTGIEEVQVCLSASSSQKLSLPPPLVEALGFHSLTTKVPSSTASEPNTASSHTLNTPSHFPTGKMTQGCHAKELGSCKRTE